MSGEVSQMSNGRSLFQVSRESGLLASTGTFGGAPRFAGGRSQFEGGGLKHVRLWPMSTEAGKFYSIGTSHRPEPHTAFGAPKNVGPGSYEVLGSANHLKSPLDGSEFCHTTMKMKSKFGWKTTGCSPGPVYILKPTVGPHVTPTYRLERMKHGERHDFMHDRNPDVGPGTYNIQDLLMGSTMSRSASSPHLSGASGGGEKTAFPEKLAGGSKRLVKSTFGVASRFDSKVGGLAGAGSSSPTGSLYYAHNSNVDTTRGQGPAPGLGSGQKTDFTRPYGGHHSGVSPVTYSPVASICKKTSSLDGFLHRGLSPQKAQAAARGD